MNGRLILRRLSWGVADQAVSSLENFLLGAYVAHKLGDIGLGVLALILLAYAIVVNLSRALATDPLVVRFSVTDEQTWRGGVRAATGVAFIIGLLSGVVCAVLGVALLRSGSHAAGVAFIALAPGLPGLTLQDSWRYAFFCVGRGRSAFAIDLNWTVLLLAALGVEWLTGMVSLAWAVATFGATAWIAGLYGIVQARTVPALRLAVGWLRRTADLGLRFVIENLTLSLGSQLRSVVLAATAGLVAVGGIRGAEMLVGPVVALLMGIAQVAVPETVRALHAGETQFRRICAALSLGLGAVSTLWTVVLLVVFPWGPGQLALGPVWPSAQALVLAVSVSATAGCFHVGPSAGLRALGRADLSWRCQASVAATYLVLATAGALVAGAQGTAWGTGIAALIGAVMWTATFRSAVRTRFAQPTVAAPAGLPLVESRP